MPTRRQRKTPSQVFNCLNCPSAFSSQFSLRRHLRKECGREPAYQCPYCPYRSKWKPDVKRHVNAWQYTVTATYPSKPLLYRRRRGIISSTERQQVMASIIELPIPCRRPDDPSTYRGTPKKFQCPKCPKRFSAKSSVVQHIKYDCNRLPRFACPYCSMRSKWPFSLYKHIRKVHPGFKVYCNDLLRHEAVQ